MLQMHGNPTSCASRSRSSRNFRPFTKPRERNTRYHPPNSPGTGWAKDPIRPPQRGSLDAFEKEYLAIIEERVRQPSSERLAYSVDSSNSSGSMQAYVHQAMSPLCLWSNRRAEYQAHDIHRRATSPNYAKNNPDVPRASFDSEMNLVYRGQKMASDLARADIDERKGLTITIPRVTSPAPVEPKEELVESEDQKMATRIMQKRLEPDNLPLLQPLQTSQQSSSSSKPPHCRNFTILHRRARPGNHNKPRRVSH